MDPVFGTQVTILGYTFWSDAVIQVLIWVALGVAGLIVAFKTER